MTKEHKVALCNLIRKYTLLRIDHFHLLGLVDDTGKSLGEVISRLRMLRDLPESRAQIEETEQLLSHVLRAVDEDALMQLVSAKASEPDLPN